MRREAEHDRRPPLGQRGEHLFSSLGLDPAVGKHRNPGPLRFQVRATGTVRHELGEARLPRITRTVGIEIHHQRGARSRRKTQRRNRSENPIIG
jgi:hypothetical protein